MLQIGHFRATMGVSERRCKIWKKEWLRELKPYAKRKASL